jgi:hypothetical protein
MAKVLCHKNECFKKERKKKGDEVLFKADEVLKKSPKNKEA